MTENEKPTEEREIPERNETSDGKDETPKPLDDREGSRFDPMQRRRGKDSFAPTLSE